MMLIPPLSQSGKETQSSAEKAKPLSLWRAKILPAAMEIVLIGWEPTAEFQGAWLAFLVGPNPAKLRITPADLGGDWVYAGQSGFIRAPGGLAWPSTATCLAKDGTQ